jgi:hypothetical protein
MSWNLYTTELAASLLGPREMSAINTHAGIDVQTDVLKRVVGKIRAYCAGAGELGEEGTIPDECEDALATLYRYALLSVLPVGDLITAARTEEKKAAENFLKLVSEGKIGISRPTTVAVPSSGLTGPGSVSPTISAGSRRRDRTGLDGS